MKYLFAALAAIALCSPCFAGPIRKGTECEGRRCPVEKQEQILSVPETDASVTPLAIGAGVTGLLCVYVGIRSRLH